MAKQTFTTGQVLTAAQMSSLQQTAMGGGTPSTKTTSYVLVAADAGTVIQMNAAGATTITVNTALFSAGDSVQIQNIGVGTCTITAGTATVNSAGSLAVTQYDGGFLYFSSASSALWFDYTQPGTTSPLTTKGDLYTRTSSADARLAVGANGTTLVANSSTSTGLEWAAPAGGGGMTLINSGGTTFSGASATVSSIPGTYKKLEIFIVNPRPATDAVTGTFRFNGSSTSNTYFNAEGAQLEGTANAFNANAANFSYTTDNGTQNSLVHIVIPDYANSTTWKYAEISSIVQDSTTSTSVCILWAISARNNTEAITSLEFLWSSGNGTSGTIYVYGVN